MKKQLQFLALLFCPFIYGQTLIGEIFGLADNDQCGTSTAISADGTILAVSSVNADDYYAEGVTRVYQYVSNNWVQFGSDIWGESAFDESGGHISISEDGNTIAIGALYNDGGGQDSGNIRIFRFISNNWVQIGQDIDGLPNEGIGGEKDTFNLSGDGNTIVVRYYNNALGKVKVFHYNSSNWVQVGQDLNGYAISSTGSYLGNAVDISYNGNIIVLGERAHIVNSQYNVGRVKVYEYDTNSSSWLQIGQDLNGTQDNEQYGLSVSISNDGSVVAIGTLNHDNPSYNGIVQVYENNSNSWVQKGQSLYGLANNDKFGRDVVLSLDGNVLAVTYGEYTGSTDSGIVKVYQYISNSWTQIGQNLMQASSQGFSKSIALSSNGTTLSVGAPIDDTNGTNRGKVWIYDLSSVLNTENFDQNSFSVYPNPVQSILHIDNAIELNKVEIYSITGKKVKSITNNLSEIDVNELESGIYFVKLFTNKGITTQKIIKE